MPTYCLCRRAAHTWDVVVAPGVDVALMLAIMIMVDEHELEAAHAIAPAANAVAGGRSRSAGAVAAAASVAPDRQNSGGRRARRARQRPEDYLDNIRMRYDYAAPH